MDDDLLLLFGWTCVAIGLGVAVILVAYRKRPTVRELLTLPDPTPAVQDAIDTGDDFDTHVDQALAIANDPPAVTCPAQVWCSHCNGPFHAHTLADILGHVRDTHSPAAADWAAWETELATPTRKDQP
jgi:hypothetical protein